ncbi:glycerophosphodiester phosphodiesterase [Sulfurospirillum sp. 1307]
MSFWDNLDDKAMLIGAHRGARSLKAENTMGAFRDAIGKSDFIELDVGFSKDGVAVVIHDDTLERTSNVKEVDGFYPPYNVVDYDYDELLKLDMGSWFNKDDKEHLPTLKEVLELLKQENFPVNIEIKDLSKTPFDKVAVKKVIELVKELEMDDLVLISSFNHKYLQEAKELAPNIKRAALQEKEHPENLVEYLRELDVDMYNPDIQLVNEELIKLLDEAKIFVNVFTIKDKKEREKMNALGVKSIFSDIL